MVAAAKSLTTREIILSRKDEVTTWMEQGLTMRDVGARLGLSLSYEALYYHFNKLGLTFKALGLAQIKAQPCLPIKDVLQQYGPVKPRLKGQRVQDYLEQNTDLILALYKYDFSQKRMAHIFELDHKVFSAIIGKAGLTRKALGLPRRRVLRAACPDDGGVDLTGQDFTAYEDMHIRRGHYCGFSASAIGAICRRNTGQILKRAVVLGLGAWPVLSSPQTRQKRAQDFDARHNISILMDSDLTRSRGPKDPASLRESRKPALLERSP